MRTVVILAKAPVLGTVKTRLARTIGDSAALALYERLLARTVARLSTGGWTVRLAVTPDDSRSNDALWPGNVARDGQGGGDLGERMIRVLEGAAADAPVVLVGSDIPGLDASCVSDAFKALETRDLVFGPAEDGGFYLVGARRPPPPNLFEGVIWSSPTTLAATLANLSHEPPLVARLADLDDAASYERHRRDGTL